jgi:hypothetical protein
VGVRYLAAALGDCTPLFAALVCTTWVTMAPLLHIWHRRPAIAAPTSPASARARQLVADRAPV